MPEIKKIDLKGLKNPEYLQLMTDVLTILKANEPCRVLITDQYAILTGITAEMEAKFKSAGQSIFTKMMQEQDRRRDHLIIGIATLINGFTYSFDPIEKAHAQMLEKYLNIFGSRIDKNNYPSETASHSKIINDWKTDPQLAIAITALSLDRWMQALELANDRFKESFYSRIQERAAASKESMTLIRKRCNTAFYTLRDSLDAYSLIKGDWEPIVKLTGSINNLIGKYMLL